MKHHYYVPPHLRCGEGFWIDTWGNRNEAVGRYWYAPPRLEIYKCFRCRGCGRTALAERICGRCRRCKYQPPIPLPILEPV